MSFWDYLTQNWNSQNTQSGSSTGSNMNQYNLAQQGLQGGLGGFYNQLLQGNIPTSFTNPAAPMQAYAANFQNYVAPQLAAQYGAKSPVIGSQEALGMQQLQGQLYNTGVGNFMNALSGASNYAFNPLGYQTQGSQYGQQFGSGNMSSQINPLLMMLMQGLGGAGQGAIGGLLGGI